MTTLTELTARMRDLASKATPGPWAVFGKKSIYATRANAIAVSIATCSRGDARMREGFSAADNAHYIAACDKTTITRLLDALATAQAVIDASRDIKANMRNITTLYVRQDARLGWTSALAAFEESIAAYDRAAGNGGTG